MKTLLLAISVLLFGISFSQTTFNVTMRDGRPANEATVSKSGVILGKTDAQGKFKVNKILKGESLVFQLNKNYKTFTCLDDNPKTVQNIILSFNDYNPEEEIESHFTPPVTERDRAVPKPQSDTKIYMDVEKIAEFPGGTESLSSFFSANVRYPDTKIGGKCYVRFTVMEDGSIRDIKITRGVPNCPECDIEAIRLISIMPKWKPAKIDNKNVNSLFDLPINFKQ